jgi:GT2 family glycosyltransferase
MRRRKRPLLGDLPRRAYLTVKHHGWAELGLRLVTAPLRLTGMERRVRDRIRARGEMRAARAWYRVHGRPVTVVIPTYGNPSATIEAVKSVRKTVDRGRTQVVVVDDGSAPEHRERLRELSGARVELGDDNQGFAATVNRGIALAPPDHDVVILNNDVLAHRHWLECLQRAAYAKPEVGIVGPKLLYPDGRIQAAGAYRNLGAPEWFDHRYRFQPADHPPADVADAALAVTGACMYVKRSTLELIGHLDASYPMAFEDVDYCLRGWEAGLETRYEPLAELTHLESVTRGTHVGERERRSQDRFWTHWGDWFDNRAVGAPDGRLHVVYVTEDTGVGGGHRDVFEHLNRLAERGHQAELYTLGGEPDWFPLEVPVRSFGSYAELAAALAPLEAIKVATWWNTARWVWRASVRRGIPVYFVQDIETSYYADPRMQARVLASYREEFKYLTISGYNREGLAALSRRAEVIPPGIDLDMFRRLERPKRDDVLLAVGRSLPLKNLPLTIEAWRRLRPQPELWMFGIEPELGPASGARYFERPSDERVNELFNEATVFVQTSVHEGFALPPLEAMSAGTAVVCTDAHGNRDFCRHEENCLIAAADPDSVAAAIGRLFADAELRGRLVDEGLRTAAGYAWERRIDELERFYLELAQRRPATVP